MMVQDALLLGRDVADIIQRSSTAAHLSDMVVFVAGNTHKGGYYHWVAQVLPAVLHGEMFDAGPFAYVTPVMKPWMRESFELVARKDTSVVELAKDHTLYADAAIYSTMLTQSSFISVPLRQMLRDRVKAALGLTPSVPFRRLFVSRRDTKRRPMTNGEAVERLCAAAGYEIVVGSELSFSDQVRLFHEASVVVGAHGGGLTNVMFCQEGAAVYELHQADVVNPCMVNLCRSAGLRYFYDLFASTGGRKTTGWTVDLRMVEVTLSSL
jgi:capsular polysaccharide biosynthesis protein